MQKEKIKKKDRKSPRGRKNRRSDEKIREGGQGEREKQEKERERETERERKKKTPPPPAKKKEQ